MEKHRQTIVITSTQKSFLDKVSKTTGNGISTVIRLMIDAEIEKAKKVAK